MVEKDVFLILAVIFLLLFWSLPWAIGSGAWINERLHLFVILLLLVVNAFSQNCETATSWLLDFALIGSLRLHLSKTCLCITMKCQNLPELWNHLTTSLTTSTTCTSSPASFSPSDPWPNRSANTPIKNLYLCGAGTYPGGEATGAPGPNNANEEIRRKGNEGLKEIVQVV